MSILIIFEDKIIAEKNSNLLYAKGKANKMGGLFICLLFFLRQGKIPLVEQFRSQVKELSTSEIDQEDIMMCTTIPT